MKLHVYSDLHNEFYRTLKNGRGEVPALPIEPDAELILLAGDIDIKLHGVYFANALAEKHGVPVAYTPGNHEYYGGNYPSHLNKMRQAANSHVFILDNDMVILNGIRIIGSTLWTDGLLFGREHVDAVRAAALGNTHLGGTEMGMNDYKKIRDDRHANYRKASPGMFFEAHKKSVSCLDDLLSVPFEGDTILMTHHAPSPLSLPAEYQDTFSSALYASDLHWLIEKHQPALCVHGHLHEASDYRIGETRVYSNPRGYLRHERALDKALEVPLKLAPPGGMTTRPG